MKISLITINRNNAAGLARTCRSILAQEQVGTGFDLEHIVVDGASTDDSLKQILPGLNSIVLVSEPQGVYNAINNGLRKASGDVIGLLHSGDELAHPAVLAEVSDAFGAGDMDYLWGDVRIGKRFYSGDDFNRKTLLGGFAPPHPSLYVSRNTFEQIGYYDENLHTAADYDYFVRLHLASNLKGRYLKEIIVNMEPGGLSQTLKNRLWHNNTERLASLRKNGLPASRLKLMTHYKKVIQGFLCSSKKK